MLAGVNHAYEGSVALVLSFRALGSTKGSEIPVRVSQVSRSRILVSTQESYGIPPKPFAVYSRPLLT